MRALDRVKKLVTKEEPELPVVVWQIAAYLREIRIGTAPELFVATEEWRQFTITSAEFTQFLTFLEHEDQQDLWPIWRRGIKYVSNVFAPLTGPF